MCPLFPHYNVPCPIICVKDQSTCPTALAATCPTGLSFCLDGTCQASCEGIVNACQCDGNDNGAAVDYLPCAAGQLVNITHFDPANQIVQTQRECAANANTDNSVIGFWGDFNTSSLWLTCPLIEPDFTYTEPMWISVWVLMGVQAVILVLWMVYKKAREAKFHRAVAAHNKQMAANTADITTSTHKPIMINSQLDESECKTNMAEKEDLDEKPKEKFDKSADTSISSESIQESEKLKFRGFLRDYFGLFAFGSVVITTLLFFVFLGCIVGDYCKFCFCLYNNICFY